MKRLTCEGNFCDVEQCPAAYIENCACSQREVWERLKYYEDLETEGRLIVLPCKVGDTVYVIDWYLDCDIDGFGVCDGYEKEGNIACGYCRHNYVKKFVNERKYGNQKPEDFGKTVFLTREEAEKALEDGDER